jgi:HlyD family secretion protein
MKSLSQPTLVIAASLALAGLAGCGGDTVDKAKQQANDPKASAAGPARTVRVAPVEMRVLEGSVVASGQLVSREEAAVNAEVTGFRVARVLADVGDTVRQGQVLVQLDDALLRSQIDQQAALLAQAEVAARQAVAQASRVAGLEGTGALAQEQIEQRRFQAESSRAAAQAQAASLADLRTRASKMAVRAPVGGVILEKTVRPGDMSGAGGQPMFRIARGGLVELAAQVPEASLASIRSGSGATVVLPDGRRIQGTVRLLSPAVSTETKLGEVRIALPSQPGLRPGGFGNAIFSGAGAPALAVPETAVNYTADGATVMMVGPQNRVQEVRVRTGRRGGGFVELLSGPPAGSLVLIGSSSFVLQGDRVNPVRAEATAARPVAPKAAAK